MKHLLVLPLLLVVAACASPPLDPEGTLERVTGGTIRAGITTQAPWSFFENGEPAGVEVELLEDLAQELDAQVEWVQGSEEDLIGAMDLGQLDVVIGGFTAESPWIEHAAMTHPYFTSRLVVAVPEGDEVPDDIAGLEVAVEANTEGAGLLEKTDAVVDIVADVTETSGPVVVDDWLLDDLGLTPTQVVLSETDHVMAVRLGENGWMVTLEKFLLARADDVPELLDEAES